jgi:hypothetical protein
MEWQQIVVIGKNEYKITNDKIVDGDLVYNKNSNNIDKCLMVYLNTLCIEFESGKRAVLGSRLYKKAIKL